MKEPVSLDLFPDELIISEDELLARRAKRVRFLWLIERYPSPNSYQLHCYNINIRCAIDVLEDLGGLGGVW